MAVSTKQLPAKENALFRSVVKCYEIKQYKKGLKTADQVLKKFPDHGETLSMKGLILSCMGKKEEAYEYARNGLKHDLKSHVCWHVYGLLNRFDRNYPEAIKCYRNAVRIDPENLQILRDMYLLQVQMRDLKGFAETRRTMLTLKPNNRNNWIGFAIAHHLIGNYQMAIDIIDKYVSTLDVHRAVDYATSEMILYQNQLIEESGDVIKALAHLEENKAMIMDTLVFRQKKAELLLQLDRYDEALGLYEELLAINFDNYGYHRGVQCALLHRKDWLTTLSKTRLPSMVVDFTKEPKGTDAIQTLRAFYADKQSHVDPKSTTCLRVPLDFTTGDDFKTLVDALLRKQLTSGVPSLGSSLKTVYAKPENVKTIERLLVSYLKTLEAKQPLIEGKPLTPSVELWTFYFAAQHYDRIGQFDKAMEYIDKCIAHTPTVLDFFQRKARILKHLGKRHEAADMMVTARKLDLADRYINNKATEYLLHADRVDEADATIALFTRHEGDPQQNLYDMQCMWYEIEHGTSQLRQRKYGPALKRFFAVEKHFDDFVEDQFDFHTYCIRTMTLRAYVDMLRLCDGIYGHTFFVKAAHGAITTYLALADEAERAVAAGDESGLSAADKKKAKRDKAKARKAEFRKKEEEELKAKLQKEAEEKEAAEKKKNTNVRAKEAPKDTDPFGEELAKKPPLEEAWRFVAKLQQYAANDIQTHVAAFDVAARKKKVLLCLQALLRGQECELHASAKQKAALAERRARFLKEMVGTVTDPIVLQVLNDKKKELKA